MSQREFACPFCSQQFTILVDENGKTNGATHSDPPCEKFTTRSQRDFLWEAHFENLEATKRLKNEIAEIHAHNVACEIETARLQAEAADLEKQILGHKQREEAANVLSRSYERQIDVAKRQIAVANKKIAAAKKLMS